MASPTMKEKRAKKKDPPACWLVQLTGHSQGTGAQLATPHRRVGAVLSIVLRLSFHVT